MRIEPNRKVAHRNHNVNVIVNYNYRVNYNYKISIAVPLKGVGARLVIIAPNYG